MPVVLSPESRMPGCDAWTFYLLASITPNAILAYLAEGLLAPLLVILYSKDLNGERRYRRILIWLR